VGNGGGGVGGGTVTIGGVVDVLLVVSVLLVGLHLRGKPLTVSSTVNVPEVTTEHGIWPHEVTTAPLPTVSATQVCWLQGGGAGQPRLLVTVGVVRQPGLKPGMVVVVVTGGWAATVNAQAVSRGVEGPVQRGGTQGGAIHCV
jgi:hypothetical protein